MSPQRPFPLTEIPPGTTLFVAGAAGDMAHDLALSLIVAGSTPEDQLLLTTTEMASETLLATCEQLNPPVDFTSVEVIDCTDHPPDETRFDAHVESLASPGDLTGLGIKFSVMYETLSDGGSTRVLTGVLTVSTLLKHADLRPTIRFLQTAAGRIEETAGIGLFVIDPQLHDDRTVSTLRQVGDGWIEVREEDTAAELRVSGLANQPAEWTPFTIPEETD